MKKWLRISLVVVGLLAFAAVVWFALPFIAFAGFAPFESIWVRLGIILFVWLLVGGIYLFRFLRARRQAKALEKGMLAGGDDSDSKVLTERMSEALKTLKTSSGKSNYLYALPWYIIIGPPGAGKTTALVKSGLKFPLADAQGGVSAIAGSGGTRYCDWWFTDEAVLVDTAGRYTTQDSDAEADKRSWLGFLQMLKRNRPKQPINGVIVAISLKDIMTMDEGELAAHSAAIRKRLLEVHHELKIDFPVYALFTKADLISGFSEYFGNFTESRRRKVWGATFQTEDRRKNMIGAVPDEFDALVKRLTEELPDRLQEEPDQISRIAIFGFPAQFAMLRDRVYSFLRQIFEANRYQVNANLRGFYFSSGTQEGTPIDQVLGAMGRSFGADGGALGHLSGIGKSYFLHDLITRVIFSETGWVSMDAAAVRRSAFFRYGTMAVVGLFTVLILGAWGWSYANNETLIDQTQKFISDYRVEAADQLNAAVVSDTDVMAVLPALDMLRDNPVGYAHRDDGTPIQEGFGLSQRPRLNASAEAAYRAGLERMFRSRLILRLEAQLQELMNDPPSAYQALKTYMMVGGVAPEVDAEFIVAWMKQDWDNQYPGPTFSSARRDLEDHLRAMLSLDHGRRPSFDLNGLLIDSAQRTLTRLSIAEQAYGYMKSLAPSATLENFNVAARAGPESQVVFETVDGSDFAALEVPAIFTYRGFREFFLPQLSLVAEQLIGEQWVRGELGKDLASDDQLRQLGPQLLSLYSADFVNTWNSVLGNIRLKALPGEKPDYIPLSILGNQSSSPLRGLVTGIVEETQLTREPADAAASSGTPGGAGSDEAQALSDAQKFIQQRLQSQTQGLQRIGIDLALKKASGRPGDVQGGGTQGVPGANIEAQFQDYAALVEGSPRAIDLLVDGFNQVFQNLFLAARNPSQATQATATAQTAVSGLQLNSSRFPAALRRIISGGVEDLEGDAAGSTIAQLNQALASEVTGICQKFTADLFPFATSSKRDLPMADFSRLFAPNGVMDKFFRDNLSQLADLSTDPWTWKQDSALGRDLSNATLRQFQRAADIRDAFFPPGAIAPQVTLTITQTSLNPAAEAALLDINGTRIQTQQLGNLPQTIQWPGSGGGAVTLTLSPEMPGRESTVSVPGPWALLRVLARNTVSRRGDTLRVTITVGGRDVTYSFQVGTVLNPFFLPALSEFSCPTGF